MSEENTPTPSPNDSPGVRSRAWRWGRVLLALLMSLIALGAVGGAGAHWWLKEWAERPPAPTGDSGGVSLVIPKGASFDAIARQLETAGLIDRAVYFKAFVLLERKQSSIQAGAYKIQPPLSPRELLTRLQKGSFQRKFTEPEGWTARRTDEALAKKGWIQPGQWTELVARAPAASPIGEPLPQGTEGFCFPDTYFLEEGETYEALHERMLRRFAKVWGELEPERRDARSAGLSAREIVTLASILQREARREDELPRMASVFLNRMEKKMKLQSCATVHYALGEVWNRALTKKDLALDSPFNTYKMAGLPPGPISNPGRAALEAALRPAQTDDLYFVHRGDGTHEFNKTYREHARAARKYRNADPNAQLQGPDDKDEKGDKSKEKRDESKE